MQSENNQNAFDTIMFVFQCTYLIVFFLFSMFVCLFRISVLVHMSSMSNNIINHIKNNTIVITHD